MAAAKQQRQPHISQNAFKMDHPLQPSVDEDTLWNELNHEHRREIRQHESRTTSAFQAVMSRTAAGLSSAAATLRSAAYRPVPQNNNLDDFGIPTTNGDPLLVQQEEEHEFILLRPFKLLQREGWGAVSNLDTFFTSLYNYYYNRGLAPILGKGVVELFSLCLTLWLSVFLFAYVDWHALAQCTDETTCRDKFSSYLIEKPFLKVSLWNFLVILYCLLFCCYTAFSCWSWVHTIRDALEAKYFFEERLGIPAHKLEGGAVNWDKHVVAKMLQLQSTGEYRIAIHGQELDALVVAQRIMRKENFMVSFFNRRMLDLSVPFLKGTYYCKSLEWSLYFCVLNYMFNHKYQIRPAFYLDPSSLKRRFILCGIAHAAFMPFLLFFMTLHFSMQNIYDMKSSKKYLGPRDWTLPAKWTFREFNELPHFFEQRMGPSYEATESYLKLFTQSTIVTTIGQLLVLIGGSLGAILIAFAALNDSILLHVKIGDWNLLWYVGILGVVYSGGKSLQPSADLRPRYIRNIFGEMEAALAQVATYTHYYPEVWKARAWDRETYKAVSSMFQYKAKLFLHEVISVILAPIILCFSLPKCADHICEFVMAIKAEVPGAGEVCGYSTFNFDVFGDETWEGRTMGIGGENDGDQYGVKSDMTGSFTASVLMTKNVDKATKMHPSPKAKEGKMEKSFFSFKANHPGWRCTESGQTLFDRVEMYKTEEEKALARERQLHIEAAAHQLEILTQMEQRRQAESGEDRAVGSDASYAELAAAGADSGGGFVVEESTPEGRSSIGQPLTRLRTDHAALSSSSVSPLGQTPEATVSTSMPFATSLPSNSMMGRSAFDPGVSAMSSTLDDAPLFAIRHPSTAFTGHLEGGDGSSESQYRLLERYHNHIALQRRQHVTQSFMEGSRTRNREELPRMEEDQHFGGGHSMT